MLGAENFERGSEGKWERRYSIVLYGVEIWRGIMEVRAGFGGRDGVEFGFLGRSGGEGGWSEGDEWLLF